ncbi:MAG: RNA-guided pseudouridylation complex pseudouridine synthase subunit Cbf5 [Nanoarchaeota archaeon]|nr:RNA-guided pseudouridylation complex pseudouridine synthase subunit Cbf5 [Nanoarchaeota archaeon]
MKPNFKSLKEKKSTKELLNFSIINLDKPSGPTSFDVSHFVKKLTGVSKTSHLGTLDPQVSGVLPITLGRACRLADYFMHHDKEYIGIMRIHEKVSEKKLKEEMKKFLGKISQLPPLRSRVKRAFREREIKLFEIIEIDGKDVLFKADVEAGTYIRKLISDLGEKIGGAHMLELRRTRASVFQEENSINLYELEKVFKEYKEGNDKELRKVLIPAEQALSEVIPTIQVKELSIKQLLTGKPLMKTDLISPLPRAEKIALFFKDRLIEVAKKVEEKDIIARPEFVYN